MYSEGSLIYDASRKPRILGKQVGSGGQGSVYEVESIPHLLIKIFHPDKLNHNDRFFDKLEAQIDMKSRIKEKISQRNVSWPQIAMFDASESYLGYAMRKMNGIPLKYLAHTQLYEKKFPGITRENIVNLMINLIDTVSKLHELEVYLGDINLENVLCDSTTWNVSLIDADSYQVGDYPCPVGRPEMTPLEHHGKDFSSVKRTKESDCFSLAILMFHCFMLGRHPYDNIGGGNPVENLEKGRFPYGTGGMAPGRDGAIPPGNWYNLWSHLSFKLKSLFIKTFKDGASDPSSRASLSEWKTALQDYSYNIKSGYNTNEVFPRTPKSSDPQ